MVHSGIDLPTAGRTLPVAAAADGEITRVQVRSEGLGKTLRLLLPDGREILYAHLSSFMPAIEESCRARQRLSSRWSLDWRPSAGTFAVRRGEWLGRTGETNDGRSLLHVELRRNGVLLDPVRHGFSWPDRSPPRIDALQFVPLGASSRLDGRLNAKSISFAQGGASAVGETFLWGPIGVVCECSGDSGGQAAPPATVLLEVDGRVGFVRDVEADMSDATWTLDQHEPELPPRSVQKLFDEGAGHRGCLQCGTEIEPGNHWVRVICSDAAGNSDTVSTGFRVQASPRMDEWMARPLTRGGWDIAVHVNMPLGEDPERTRLWVDLTEDGMRFPVRTLLGHLGSGWFLGEIAPVVPSGAVGMRVRIQTPAGVEVWGSALSIDPRGLCPGAITDTPEVEVTPSWLIASFAKACIPAREPTGVLRLPGFETPCVLLDVVDEDEPPAVWRFVSGTPRGRAGGSPHLVLRLGDATLEWRMPQVVAANDRDDLLWTSPGGALTLEASAGTFFGPVWLLWTMERGGFGEADAANKVVSQQSPSDSKEMLVVRSDQHAIGPAGLEIDGVFRLSLRPRVAPSTPEEARRILVFGREDVRTPWAMRGGVWTGSAVAVVVDRLEEWILLEDTTEPWIYAMEPSEGERRQHSPTGLSARIREDGSGVKAEDVAVWIDGKSVPAKWNPWSRAVSVELMEAPSPGAHRWEMRVMDRAGNVARRSADFAVFAEP